MHIEHPIPPREYAFGLEETRAALARAEESNADEVVLTTGEDHVEIGFDEVEDLPAEVRNALIPVVGYNASRTMTLQGLFDWISE